MNFETCMMYKNEGEGVVVGSISAALSCLVYPPREERLDA